MHKPLTSVSYTPWFNKKKKITIVFYYGTIGILLGTLIIVCLFFYFLAPVQETLSRIGASLMITSLSIRILIEVNSIYKAKRIKPTDNTLSTAQHSIHFHQLRKKIHQNCRYFITSCVYHWLLFNQSWIQLIHRFCIPTLDRFFLHYHWCNIIHCHS